MIWRWVSVAFGTLLLIATAHAQTSRLDQFPPAAALGDSDITVVEQGGKLPAKQVPLSLLKAYLQSAPIAAIATTTSPPPPVRPDQLGAAATLSDNDLIVIRQAGAPTTTVQVPLGALKFYYANSGANTPQVALIKGAAFLVDNANPNLLAGPATCTSCASTPVVTQTLTGVALSNNTFLGGSASGTTVGSITVSILPNAPAFSGFLALSGPNANQFQLVGTGCANGGACSLATSGVVAAGNYSLNIVATQAGATGSPLTQAFTITGGASFTAVSLSCGSSCSFTAGTSVTIGTASAILSGASSNVSWSLATSGFDHTGTTACSDYSADFTISSGGGALSNTAAAPAQTYPGLCITATQASVVNSPYTQAFNNITGNASIGNPTVQTIVVDSQPSSGAQVLEKTIDYFTSATNPSIVVGFDSGSPAGLWIYTNNGSINGTWTRAANIGGAGITDCYERTRSIKFTGDSFPNIVASCNNTVSVFRNPANTGGNPLGTWPRTIVTNRGSHSIRVADIDGDGRSDIIASASQILGVGPNFIAYQNSPTSWQSVDGPIPPGGTTLQDDLDVLPGVAGNNNNIVGPSDAGGVYWFAYPGSRTGAWTSHVLTSNADQGTAVSATSVGGLGVVAVGNNEVYNNYVQLGLRYFTQPANPNNPWVGTTIDATMSALHEISMGSWQGLPYIVAAEEEQSCIDIGQFNPGYHPGTPCRVTLFRLVSGSWVPTQLDPLGRGTQDQSVIAQGNNLLIAGANHQVYGGYPPLQLWVVSP